MPDRPNFVFIITDQHRADYLGCYGHPVLRTPNIDSIAARGTCFDKFYVATPVCMPNRASIMTGRMPSVHGLRHNGLSLDPRSNTFVDLLRADGYDTALIGKSHLQNFGDKPPLLHLPDHPDKRRTEDASLWEARLPVETSLPIDSERPGKWQDNPDFELPKPYFGFDHIELCTRHGDRVGGHYYHWLKERYPNADELIGPKNALPHDYTCPQAWRTAVPEDAYPTAYVTSRTEAWLNSRESDDAPFFLQVSFPDPHHPFTPPGKYWDMYDPADMALPASWCDADPETQPHVAYLQEELRAGRVDPMSPAAKAVKARHAQEAMALTCGMISMIDDGVGRILATLRARGLDDNTVVIFTTDHGDLLGDHQLLLKGPMHFQGLIRVPFIWSDPGAGHVDERSSALTSSIDIAPTVLDRAGVAPFNGMQGQSMLPYFQDSSAHGRNALLIEDEIQKARYGFDAPIRCRTLVTRDARLSIYQGVDWGEFYDLEDDPSELKNRWFDPDYQSRKGEFALALAHAEMSAADRSPLPTTQG